MKLCGSCACDNPRSDTFPYIRVGEVSLERNIKFAFNIKFVCQILSLPIDLNIV